jgi:hypothetical protein
MKSTLGLIGAAIPVLYCGGLVIYFAGVNRSFGGMLGRELGPTMVGLGVIGLLFLIPLVLKIRKLAARPDAPAPPGAGGGGDGGPVDQAPQDPPSDFDPDAALARYMARRSSGAHGPASPSAPHPGGGPVRQAGFGRRGA